MAEVCVVDMGRVRHLGRHGQRSLLIKRDFYDKSPAERKLVFKLDVVMLTTMTIGWWIKNLDQSNVSRTLEPFVVLSILKCRSYQTPMSLA